MDPDEAPHEERPAKGPVDDEAAEGWFRRIVEGLPNAMLVVDASRRILLVNHSAETLFGYHREELVGREVEMLIPARFRAAHPAHFEGFLRAPKGRAMGAGRELYGTRKDGTEVPIEIGLNPVETSEGLFTLASVIDITTRKHAEAAVRASEERFRLMVEGVRDYAILMLDPEGKVVSWNAGARRMKGYEADEILGRHFRCFYSPEDAAAGKPEQELQSALDNGRHEDEGFRYRKGGERFWANVVVTAMRDEQGELVGFSKMTRDLTQRRIAEERFQRVVEASPTGMAMVSPEGKILLVNAQVEALFGYTRDELVGQSIEKLVPPRFRAAHPAHRQTYLTDATPRAMGAGRDLFGLRKDGSEFVVEIGLNPIETMDGKAIMASIIDITERKRIEDELRRSNAELEQFAYIASHDLQEPLRMVASYTELLGDRYRGTLDEKADKYIHYAVDGAKRMQRLVTDLLAYSRVGSQGKALVPVSSANVVQSVLEMLAPTLDAVGGTVEVSALPDVLADEGQLRLLFQNLIGNALKFRGDAPPVVRVEARRVEDRWLFSVADNGIGIDMKYADRIFLMFQRLHERGKFEGSGIGLAIAQRIAERHGGRIRLASKLGLGSTFSFSLSPAPTQVST